MKRVWLSGIILITALSVHAQVLNRTVQKLKAGRNLSYVDIVSTKFSFQEDFSSDTIQSYITFNPTEQQTGGYYLLQSTRSINTYDGGKSISLSKSDSTYTIQTEALTGQNTRTLLYWAQQMYKYANHPKTRQLGDSLINNSACHHIQVIARDSIQNNVRCYIITDFYINKKTGLPSIINTKTKGLVEDGSVMGIIEVHKYSNYDINKPNFPDLTVSAVPSYFKLPAKKKPVVLLSTGTLAPPIDLYDLEGKLLDFKSLAGKTVLLNFTLIGCPHCVAAADMLNQLTKMYKDAGLVVATIYPLDKKDAIEKFNKRFDIKALTYITSKDAQQTYPYDGYPTFYLIDKHGKVAQAYNGYYKELQEQLTAKINSIK